MEVTRKLRVLHSNALLRTITQTITLKFCSSPKMEFLVKWHLMSAQMDHICAICAELQLTKKKILPKKITKKNIKKTSIN